MRLTYKSIDKLVKDLRLQLNVDLDVTESESSRSLIFEASKPISDCAAYFRIHKISITKLKQLPLKEVKQLLTKKFAYMSKESK